jgi:hypothetical protein
MLTAPLQLEEIHTTINQMDLNRSLGPDGMNPAFINNQNWKHCGVDVYNAFCTWLVNDFLPPDLNKTNIVLPPNGESILCKIGGLYRSLGDEIQKMINSFWLDSNSGGNRGIHWLSWDKLSQPMKVKDIRF